MEMLIQASSKLVMIGDSVTDCGRLKPVGEGQIDALGNGYVSMVDALIQATMPWQRIRVVNMGLSGNTVRDLKMRWQSDVFALFPDWLSIMIGINDVWRQYDSPFQTEWGVPLDEYESTLENLIEQTQPQLKGLVLMTPYFIDLNFNDGMRVRMDQYSEVVRGLARKHQAILVDTQMAFDVTLHHLHPMALSWDRIHPNIPGHMIIARSFLNAIGYRWEKI
jgi:lysophospholipase L1-like esterase